MFVVMMQVYTQVSASGWRTAAVVPVWQPTQHAHQCRRRQLALHSGHPDRHLLRLAGQNPQTRDTVSGTATVPRTAAGAAATAAAHAMYAPLTHLACILGIPSCQVPGVYVLPMFSASLTVSVMDAPPSISCVRSMTVFALLTDLFHTQLLRSIAAIINLTCVPRRLTCTATQQVSCTQLLRPGHASVGFHSFTHLS